MIYVYIMYILHSPLSTITSIFVFPLPPPTFFFSGAQGAGGRMPPRRQRLTHLPPRRPPRHGTHAYTTSRARPPAPQRHWQTFSKVNFSRVCFLHILISELFAFFLFFLCILNFFFCARPPAPQRNWQTFSNVNWKFSSRAPASSQMTVESLWCVCVCVCVCL